MSNPAEPPAGRPTPSSASGSGSDPVARAGRAVRPLSAGRRELVDRVERATGHVEREVVIADAQAIRALAHEARQQVIDVLYGSQKAHTATQLAILTGLSPSAMSYHLRALERWGVLVRADEDGDARNRPWRAAGTSINVAGEGAASEAAQATLRAVVFRGLERRIRRARALPPERRTGYVGLALGQLWLDPQQVETVALSVERTIVELYEAGWVNEPAEGRERMSFIWSLLPDPPAGGVEPEGVEPPGADGDEGDTSGSRASR